MYPFAKELPRDDSVAVWALQQYLLCQAELRFGSRDVSKKIYQPSFHGGAPQIINSASADGAWAVLSSNAGGYWPTAMYELAHETVHLLNPIIGGAKYLEEGLAVKFSVEMSAITTHPMEPIDVFYKHALDLVNSLPSDPYAIAKTCRATCGSLDCVTPSHLVAICPRVPIGVANELCARA